MSPSPPRRMPATPRPRHSRATCSSTAPGSPSSRSARPAAWPTPRRVPGASRRRLHRRRHRGAARGRGRTVGAARRCAGRCRCLHARRPRRRSPARGDDMSETTTRSTQRSQALFAKAQEHLAGGVGSGTRSPRSGWRPAPVYVDHATGSRVTDVDGNEYIDYQMGQGPLILGHRPPAVLEAVTRTINERGSLFALAHDLEAQAADAVSARMPSMEALRFGNSGSECVSYALRFARAATERTLVLRFEGCYHGWTDGIHWSAHPSLDEAGPAGLVERG